jgi:hypothetical protein
MTIAQQLKLIKSSLDPWAQSNKGKMFIAADLVDLFTLLRTPPGGVRGLVMFHSELKRGEYEESGMVDRTFWVTLSRGRSMKLSRGDDLVSPDGGPPLFDLVESARQVVRDIAFDSSTEVYPNFRGISPFNIEGFLMDSYTIEFSIGVQLPGPDTHETTDAATPQ